MQLNSPEDTIVFDTVNSEIFARVYFRETSHMRSFVKIKSSQNSEITLLFTDIEKSCPSRELLATQICLLTLFAKIKLSRKFPNLQYINCTELIIRQVSKQMHKFDSVARS